MAEPQEGAEAPGRAAGRGRFRGRRDSVWTSSCMRLLPSVPRSRIFRIVRKGEVRVNGKRASPEHRLQERDTVRVPPVRIEAEPVPGAPARVPHRVLELVQGSIISEDERLLVLDKPAGVAVHGGSGLSFGVIEALRALRPEENAGARASARSRHQRLPAGRPQAQRAAHASRAACAKGRSRSATSRCSRGTGISVTSASTCPLRTDIRVGGERTVKAHAIGQGGGERVPADPVLRQASATLVEVALAHRPHAPDPRACGARGQSRGGRREVRRRGVQREMQRSAA